VNGFGLGFLLIIVFVVVAIVLLGTKRPGNHPSGDSGGGVFRSGRDDTDSGADGDGGGD
jgi:hypothetical protein